MNKQKIIRIVLFCLFAAIFCVAAYQLIKVKLEYRENEQIYSEAIDQFVIYTPTEPPVTTPAVTTMPPQTTVATTTVAPLTDPGAATTSSTTAETTLPPETTPETTTTAVTEPIPTYPNFTLDWAALKAANPDIVAWIWQSGTTINYPILKSDTNDEYLYTTYNYKYSRLGSIFLDSRSALDRANPIIYGHNAGNGMMFATLVKYKNWSYFDQHRYFYILTENGVEKYAVFSVYKVKTYSDTYTFRFDDAESYAAYLEKILLRSAYNMGVSVSPTDHIVTLSTCTNTGDEDRYVVHAKRIEG